MCDKDDVKSPFERDGDGDGVAHDAVTATDFVDEFVAALVAVRVYDRTHPRVRSTVAELMRLHALLLARSQSGSLVLATVDGYLLFEDRPLLGASVGAVKLIDALVARGAGGLELDRRLQESDVEALLQMLGGPVRENGLDDANRRLKAEGCHSVGLLPPYREGLGSGRLAADGRNRRATTVAGSSLVRIPVHLHQRIVDSLQGASIDVARGGKIDLQDIQSVAQTLTDAVRMDPGGAMNMARYERYDAFTFGHSMRVCALATNFAARMTNDLGLLYRIGVAALLHDIGKSLIPFEILHHRGRLSPEQRREMERHPALGAQILLDHPGIDDLAVTVSFGHHRNRDGSGYPRDVATPDQTQITRLIKICDVYEALTAVRPYKGAMTPIEAFAVMSSMQGQFDPTLFRKFVVSTGCYPVGSLVTLSDGTIARVLRQSSDLLRPVVQTEGADSGQSLHAEDVREIDLSAPANDDALLVTALLEMGRIAVDLAPTG